jgi:hypothetical protein
MDVSPRGAVRSARLPVTEKVVGSNPIEDARLGRPDVNPAYLLARYANRQSGQAQTLDSSGSNPARATGERRGLNPTWQTEVASPFTSALRLDARLVTDFCGLRSSTQTRQSGHREKVVIVCGFDSHLDHSDLLEDFPCVRIWLK